MTTTECEICFAVVVAESSGLHREWHERIEVLLLEALRGGRGGEP